MRHGAGKTGTTTSRDNMAGAERKKLRVLELYSGIGGMHWALAESGIPYEVVGAADINNVANDIYRHNFRDSKIFQKVIESFTVKDLDKLSPDMITMSPPCQPFTRVGLQKDSKDERTKSFFHVLDLLPKLSKLPAYILLENVKGFETSVTHQELLDTLGHCGYSIQEFLLTPNQFGVPNSRLRYYLLAKRPGLNFNFPTVPQVRDDIPVCMEPHLIHIVTPDSNEGSKSSLNPNQSEQSEPSDEGQNNLMKEEEGAACSLSSASVKEGVGPCNSETQTEEPEMSTNEQLALRERYQSICRPVADYLEGGSEEYFRDYLLNDKWFKRFWSMDIILKDARSCCCFTKAYAHRIEGAGSILQTVPDAKVDLNMYKEKGAADETTHEAVRGLGLRFFTPREVANIMCFPKHFCFPENLTAVQCYRVLGNSLNVHVVSILMRLLYHGDDEQWTDS